jgi:hypothetical protein
MVTVGSGLIPPSGSGRIGGEPAYATAPKLSTGTI